MCKSLHTHLERNDIISHKWSNSDFLSKQVYTNASQLPSEKWFISPYRGSESIATEMNKENLNEDFTSMCIFKNAR